MLDVLYLVGNTGDAAVDRRVSMLRTGGAIVSVAGFRRAGSAAPDLGSDDYYELGETFDARFLQRTFAIARAAGSLTRRMRRRAAPDVIVARNLEMLFLAVRLRRMWGNRPAIVYECLDIHRVLLGKGVAGSLLRSTESALMQGVDLILTSSPRFISEYFDPRNFNRPIRLVENKVLLSDPAIGRPDRSSPAAGPPWKIGWFGMIRCRRSFEILRAAARDADGSLQIGIAGRPSPKEFPDFEALLAQSPHVTFTGAYRFDELSALYGDVHFSWAVDFFEQGLNSTWLLPNRVYESSFFGAVPIAVGGVETARWLAERKIGAILDGDPEASLRNFLATLTEEHYRGLAEAVQRVPLTDLVDGKESCQRLLEALERPRVRGRAGC